MGGRSTRGVTPEMGGEGFRRRPDASDQRDGVAVRASGPHRSSYSEPGRQRGMDCGGGCVSDYGEIAVSE